LHFDDMKKIEAIIRPHKQDALLQALAQSNALAKGSALGVTVVNTVGFGRQKGHSDVYRGVKQEMGVVPKRMLILYVNDDQVDSVVKLITDVAQTGQMGDGKIAVFPMDNLTRIRTGEQGESAL
jgi:nitrogen regulatory protein P-II 1